MVKMTNWQTKKLGDVGAFSKGSGIPKDSAQSGELPAVRYGELYTSFDTFIRNTRSKIDQEIANSATRITKGDILFAGSGETVDEIGKSAVYLLDEVGYAGGDIVIMHPNIEHYAPYLGYLLNSETARKELRKAGQGQSVVHIYRKDLENLALDIPEKPEQQRIVGILEVWDEYIEKLEQKIALKEQLKKGLMQQLLTGRRRLPGFSDAWITVSLGEVGHARTSSVDKLSVAGEQSVRLLNYMDIYRRDHISNSDTFQMVTAKNTQIITSDLKKGDVLFTPSSETPTDIGHSAVVIEDLPLTVFSYHLMRLRMKDRYLSVNFAAYCFKTRAFYNELWKRAQGATRFTLSKEALESAKITIPADLEEQDQIAGILEVVDREIETLRSTLREIKLQKKYLLKNLITGTIRTPDDLQPLDTSRLERSAL